MSDADLSAFRLRCRQFRWLAVFMVVSVGAMLTLAWLIAPVTLWLRDGRELGDAFWRGLIMNMPTVCYLFGVWSIGRTMKRIADGAVLQPAVADALRQVGLALGIGGVISVFMVMNLMRLVGLSSGGWLYFDVPGMTLGMIGGALFLLGRVMDQAAAAQAELDEMI